MTGNCCTRLKDQFDRGLLSDEAQLVLRGVKAWVEWVEDPLRDDKQRYEFNARAVAAYYQVHGRLPSHAEKWDFSHAGNTVTVTGQWWNGQKHRYKKSINVNTVVRSKWDVLSDEEDGLLTVLVGAPWQQWKADEHIIVAILRYKELQGDAWDGTVSESFVVPKRGEEGSGQWHEKLWGMELGQLASSLRSGARVVYDPAGRLKRAGFVLPQIRRRKEPSLQQDARWDCYYRALRDYVDTHDGNLPIQREKYTFEGTALSLGTWVANQRSRYNSNKESTALADDRRERLEQLPAFLQRVAGLDRRQKTAPMSPSPGQGQGQGQGGRDGKKKAWWVGRRLAGAVRKRHKDAP
jgi:hypothetical protein